MKHILFRVGKFMIPTESAPLLAAVSGACMYGLYTGVSHLGKPEIRKHRSNQCETVAGGSQSRAVLTILVHAVEFYVFERRGEHHLEEETQMVTEEELPILDERGFVRCGKCNRFCPQEFVGNVQTDTPCIFCQNPVDALKGKGRYTETLVGKDIRHQYSYDSSVPVSLNASNHGSFVVR
ncbi:hypothetical protein EV175_003227 [Coemansia sp. RSA 1933]|nr:hypothetical protein EV175_003227 [Coemansia sp. RSA 1933]